MSSPMEINQKGLALCTRFAYPPNSLHLCGPERQIDIQHYHTTSLLDSGAVELISQFNTLYPYLCLIASHHHLSPFDPRVVEAYWLGNPLLKQIPVKSLLHHVEDEFALRKKLTLKDRNSLYETIAEGGLAHHAFHVIHIYTRTGHDPSPQTVASMDACIINWGQIVEIHENSLTVNSRPLRKTETGLVFGASQQRVIEHAGSHDVVVGKLKPGDTISYHWGKLCTKLNQRQQQQLQTFTNLSLHLANQRRVNSKSDTHVFR